MVYKNLKGTTKKVFSMALGSLKVFIGSITTDGLLQGQDADQRTVRDLIQYAPRYHIPAGYNQVATHHEVHNFERIPLELDEGSSYELDKGAIVIL